MNTIELKNSNIHITCIPWYKPHLTRSRDIKRLEHPSALGGSGSPGRRGTHQGVRKPRWAQGARRNKVDASFGSQINSTFGSQINETCINHYVSDDSS